MTNWSIPVVRAVRSVLILLVVSSFPSTAWVQEPSTGTASVSQQATASPEQQGKYVIKQGDTLWDIANAFYRDPFLWPLIWKSNPSVNDPDLIYPGNALVVPSLAPVERAMSAPEEAAPAQETAVVEKSQDQRIVPTAAAAAQPQEEAEASSLFQKRISIEGATPEPEQPATGNRLILPEDAAVPIMDKYAMLSAGFVSEEDSPDHIQGSVDGTAKGVEGSNLLGYDSEVYIVVKSRETVNIGDRFLIFEPMHKVKHPETRRDFGKLYKVNGILKVTGAKETGVYTARITLSFDSSIAGNMLAPYQEPALIYPAKQKQEKNLTGQILDVTDRRSINGQVDIVYLDKGKEDGVEPGDRFTVMGVPSKETGVTRPIGEIQVFIVKSRTATAVVRKSIDTMTTGYRFVYKN